MVAKTSPFNHVAIVGVGLIGGSIHKALKLCDPTIKITLIDKKLSAEKLKINLKGVELVILAMPLSDIIPTARSIETELVVMDVGSVKEAITQEFEQLSSEKIEFVSTHPMAGKEKSGEAHSSHDLFDGKPWALIPHSKNKQGTLRKIFSFVECLNAKPLILTSREHDDYAALISHLPAILARNYHDFVKQVAPNALRLAGTGYESFTRLAHDNPVMRKEIESLNQAPIQNYLNLWKLYNDDKRDPSLSDNECISSGNREKGKRGDRI